jgi:hypothetical protein
MASVMIFGALDAASRALRDRAWSFALAAGALALLPCGGLSPRSRGRPADGAAADVCAAAPAAHLARELRLAHASALVADAGAMLVESGLTVYDAAGLFEPAVVSRLKRGRSATSIRSSTINSETADLHRDAVRRNALGSIPNLRAITPRSSA